MKKPRSYADVNSSFDRRIVSWPVIKFFLTCLVMTFGALGIMAPPANACSMSKTDTTSIGTAGGCNGVSFKYESVNFNVSEIVKSGESLSQDFKFSVKISVNEPNSIKTLVIVPYHFTNESTNFDGDKVCVGLRQMNAEVSPELFSNYVSDGQRKIYTFDLSAQIANSCDKGDIYYGVRPSHSTNVTGSTIRGKSLPANRLFVKPVEKFEGALCESNEGSAQVQNSDGSIWFCARDSISSPFKWRLISGSTPIIVTNCMMTCEKKTLTPTQASKTQSPKPTSTKAASKSKPLNPISCLKAGELKKDNLITYACVLKGKKLEWIIVSGGSTNQNNSKPTLSEADKLKNKGCSAFPSAIVKLQNTSGGTYNKAVVAAQEASFHIIDAAQLDKKYEGLRNAQRIIAQYAQNVGWGGKGYFGDINTVRTAIATFNMSCNSNLTIG